MALVSIITPAYNSAKYIAQTVYSVQNQTYSNWELIIVDDCSQDRTVEIVANLAANDTRIKLIQLAVNSGSGVARNTALNEASGNYIAFLDADDLWKPTKLQEQLHFMKTHDLPLTFSFYELMDENANPLNEVITTPLQISYNQLYYCNWVGNLTGIYSVDYFGKIPISSFKKRQDWMLWLTLVKQVGKVIPTPENLAYYRVRKDSISASKWKLIKYNYLVYKEYHQQGALKAGFDLIRFLFTQMVIKPKYKIQNYTKL